jgi:integrase
LPGTRRRIPLFDESNQRIRGLSNKSAAEEAFARSRLADADGQADGARPASEWLVAQVCSEYLQYCERGVARGSISAAHHSCAISYLNDLCAYCGALRVAELSKGHIQTWLEKHAGWRSTATHRTVLAVVLAAFNQAEEMFDVPNPLKGLKRPPSRPRLHSLSARDEQALYDATEECFRNFLFAALHSGMRPFCELARLTADHVEETDRGMMWRVYSTKTKKTRKIPVQSAVATLTRRLMPSAPRGSGRPIFRNTQGNPWKRMTGVVRFLAIKKKLGWDQHPEKRNYSCYSCRHTFAHRMLSGFWTAGAGCTIETLAELIGDTPKVAFDHYGREWGQHYQDPLWNAIGVGLKPARTSPANRHSKKAGKKSSAKQARPDRKPKKDAGLLTRASNGKKHPRIA